MNWHFTRPGLVSFRKGEPFCFIAPVPHAAVDEFEPVVKDLASEPALQAEYDAWSTSRTTFLENLRLGDAETLKQRWQRHYYKGETVLGAKPAAETHIHKRRLKAPRRAGPEE
jgi:hypothetical protein